jgi:hypothetical protein
MLDTPTHISDEDIVAIITKGISDGKAQSACIWEIIRSEIPDYGAPERRQECYRRYNELTAFIQSKGLYVSEQSQLML